MSLSASIELIGAFVDFPVFNAISRSFKHRVIQAATGGILDHQDNGVVIVRSLQNISFKISQGERVGIIGHNGSGKTTLLRVISGIYHPTAGKAILKGDCKSLININLGIDPEATGRENIRLRAAMMGLTPAQTKERMNDIISFSGLGDFIEMPLRTYSSGMQLRLAFAVSTSISPQILVMDEWLSTGDRDFKERADVRLNKIVNSTEILIIASHSRELLTRNCNRVIWLDHGEIKMDGKMEDVVKEYFR